MRRPVPNQIGSNAANRDQLLYRRIQIAACGSLDCCSATSEHSDIIDLGKEITASLLSERTAALIPPCDNSA